MRRRKPEPLSGSVGDLAPVSLMRVSTRCDNAVWRELIGRYYYLGHRPAYRASLRYVVKPDRPSAAAIGCLPLSSSAWRMAAGDRWNEQTRQQDTSTAPLPSKSLWIRWCRRLGSFCAAASSGLCKGTAGGIVVEDSPPGAVPAVAGRAERCSPPAMAGAQASEAKYGA